MFLAANITMQAQTDEPNIQQSFEDILQDMEMMFDTSQFSQIFGFELSEEMFPSTEDLESMERKLEQNLSDFEELDMTELETMMQDFFQMFEMDMLPGLEKEVEETDESGRVKKKI